MTAYNRYKPKLKQNISDISIPLLCISVILPLGISSLTKLAYAIIFNLTYSPTSPPHSVDLFFHIKGGDFHEVDNDWSENTLTWERAPEPDPNPVVSLGPVARRTWVEVDLSSVIVHDGIYSFRVISPSRDGADYQTKERRGREPELILTVK